jgi:pSer/pThr/pTyr-binding forkhead associated (FHA) protein
MPKLIVSIDGVVIKEVQITKDRTTLGRRPYNDIVIDNLAISGEHAVVLMVGSEVHLEDLNSTNGTYINGKAARKQILQNNDLVEVGKYKLKFVADGMDSGFERGVLCLEVWVNRCVVFRTTRPLCRSWAPISLRI